MWISISFFHTSVTYSLKEKRENLRAVPFFFLPILPIFFFKKSEKIKEKFKLKEMRLKSIWTNNVRLKENYKYHFLWILPIFFLKKSKKIKEKFETKRNEIKINVNK